VKVDDAIEDVEDRVDADGEGGWTAAGTEFREADQSAEHDCRLVERLHRTASNSVTRNTADVTNSFESTDKLV